jgi:hypothetical protein
LNKKGILIFVIITAIIFSIFPGCMVNSLSLTEIILPYGDISYSLMKTNIGHPTIIYSKEITNIELIFNKELSSEKNFKIFSISKDILPKTLLNGVDFEISGREIIIKGQITQNITSFMIPDLLRSNQGLKMMDDLYIYFSPSQFDNLTNSDTVGVQKILKKKGDGKKIGIAVNLDALPIDRLDENYLQKAYTEIPVYNNPNNKKIFSLKNGDGFEIISEHEEFDHIAFVYKDERGKITTIRGYIQKKFVYRIPEPLNNDVNFSIFSQQFLCVVAKKIMSNVPNPLPYFPYIQVQVNKLGNSGIEILQSGALPLTEEKTNLLELNALFNTIIGATDIEDNLQNTEYISTLTYNVQTQDFCSAFIKNYIETLEDFVQKFNVASQFIQFKQEIINYINLKSYLVLFRLSLGVNTSISKETIINNFMKRVQASADLQKKIEDIAFKLKDVNANFSYNEFVNEIKINILKQVEIELATLSDQAFFPVGNWVREEFNKPHAL